MKTTKEIVDGYNKCKTFHTRKWLLESEVRDVINKQWGKDSIDVNYQYLMKVLKLK